MIILTLILSSSLPPLKKVHPRARLAPDKLSGLVNSHASLVNEISSVDGGGKDLEKPGEMAAGDDCWLILWRCDCHTSGRGW